MSSPEEDFNENESAGGGPKILKKRRIHRACDTCRRKKVRCDGPQMPDHRCTYCATNKYECTYVEAAAKKPIPKSYVHSLETRLQKMEALLQQIRPDVDLTQDVAGNFSRDTQSPERSDRASANVLSTAAAVLPPSADADSLEPSDDEMSVQDTLENRLKQMQINPAHIPFFGKSSSVMFLQTAIEAKHEYAGAKIPSKKLDYPPEDALPTKRPQFWHVHPWVMPLLNAETPEQIFPEKDLLYSLIDLYFTRVNDYVPLLHRPTFENSVLQGVHLREKDFGAIVLLVCSLGSRFSDDPRVFLEDVDSTHSCGWPYFRQVQQIGKSMLSPPRLTDMQQCCLAAMFLLGTSTPQASWTVIGVGIRLAQDVGAHRQKAYNTVNSVGEELWKRAFWVLIYLDRTMGMGLGRACAIQDEDFDLDFPVECDDEYWVVEDNQCEFNQPPNKPSKMLFFNNLLRLNQILAFALRTIYSINKSKVLLGFIGQQWEQRIVAELDSALNKWIDAVPEHLRWDPNREDLLFLNQSAYLYAHYYQVQITVHRPFIPSPRKPSPLSFPSLAICTNAARSCIHVLDVPFRRSSRRSSGLFLFTNQISLFTCGIVLLLNIWGGKRSGSSIDPAKEMADVHKCMRMLKSLEPRWYISGRLWDILYELASVGDLPLPQPSPAPSNKRTREPDSSYTGSSSMPSEVSSTSSPMPVPFDGVRDMAGSRRVSMQAPALPEPQYMPQAPPQTPGTSGIQPPSNADYALPIYSEDLGRLPLHLGSNAYPTTNRWMGSSPTNTYASTSHPSPSTAAPTCDLVASMYSIPPAVYDQVMAGFPAPDAQNYPLGSGTTSLGGGTGSSMFTDSLNGCSSTIPDSDTLAMWSNAPQGFEWDDWGSFVDTVSGMSNPSDSGTK